MKRDVVFTKDGNFWLSLDPPGAFKHLNDSITVTIDLNKKDNESADEFNKRCQKEGIKQLIKRYFNLRDYSLLR